MVLHDPVELNRSRNDQIEYAGNARTLQVKAEMTPAAEVKGSRKSKSRAAAMSPLEVLHMLDSIRLDAEQNPEAACTAAMRLVSVLTELAAARSPIARGGLAPWQKRKLDQHLREHLTHLHRVDELAQQVSLSVSHFHRAFRQTFGETPRAYVLRLKLDKAKERMLATEEPLAQIALASGFADQSHFCKIFRRLVGDTPAAWRRRESN